MSLGHDMDESDSFPAIRPLWLNSFADLLTILLAFFALMMSPQAVVSESQNKAKEALTESLNDLQKKVEDQHMGSMVHVEQNGNQASLILKDSLLFESGSAELSSAHKETLRTLLQSLKPLVSTHYFKITGHTDSIPINSSKYKSNWHLSTNRALAILDEFINNGFDEQKLSAQGFASYKPLVPEKDKDGNPITANRSANRRVEIHIR